MTKINLMQDLLNIIILTVKSNDVTKINLMQDLLNIIILDCKTWRCDKNQFDARFITYIIRLRFDVHIIKTIKYDDVTKINLMQNLLHII